MSILPLKARVFITLKNGVLDPQGKAIGHALNGLGFGSVGEVRQGKVIDLELADSDADKAKADAQGDVRKAARQHRDREIRDRVEVTMKVRRHRLSRFQLRPRRARSRWSR